MSNFKVGDRIRLTVATWGTTKVGDTGTIILNSNGCGVEFDNFCNGHDCNGKGKEGHCWWVSDNEMELVEKAHTPKFKVGDRVKAIAKCDGNEKCIGKTGTITEVYEYEDDPLPICVEFDEEMGGWGEGHKNWHCEAESLELLDTEPTKPTKPILIIDETPPKEDYSNSCWYCRKGGLVDLYLNGDMGICPKCGRLCNAPPSVAPIKAFKHSKVAEPTTNEPLTTEELKSMDGQKVWCSSLINNVEKFNDEYCSWYTVDRNTEEITQEGTGRKYSFDSNNNPWGYRAYRNKPIMAGG